MDVWEDIKFNNDRTRFGFLDAERLFNFLLLRAYEFQELLFNPYSRALDLFLKKIVEPLYKRKIISKEDLLTHDNDWLYLVLNEHYPMEVKCYIEPEKLSWKRFRAEKELRIFCDNLNPDNTLDHIEYIAGFASGLDWLVWNGRKLIPLRSSISENKVKLLEKVIASTKGYYAYYKKS